MCSWKSNLEKTKDELFYFVYWRIIVRNKLIYEVVTKLIGDENNNYNLYGEYQHILGIDNRITLPSKFYQAINKDSKSQEWGLQMTIIPIEDCLKLIPLADTDFSSWVKDMEWVPSIKNLVQNNKIHPAYPYYSTNDSVSVKIRDVYDIIKDELQIGTKYPRNISGKDFEKLLYDILTCCGFNVQLNFRLFGGEIDLLLSEVNNNGKIEYTIIECKNREISNGKISINQIMRLYGLNEALKTNMCMKNSMIVSTTGFTRNAKQISKLYNFNALDFDGFMKWIDEHRPNDTQIAYPLFMTVNVDTRKRLRIPNILVQYVVSNNNDISIVGVSNSIEIWNKKTWNDYNDWNIDDFISKFNFKD